MYILNFIRGFCMALADSVPGVSGGTIAFILGFYDDFVNSLNSIISGDKLDRIRAFKFMSKIGIGWIIGFMMSALFITSIFENNIYEINSLFLGFIIASIPLIVKSEREILKNNKSNLISLLIGIIIVVTITYFNQIIISESSFSIQFDNINLLSIIYIFISGMIAISAMVLPGISGSTILLIFGLYTTILNSIKKILHFEFEHLPCIIIFGCGVLFGLFATVRIVRSLLKRFRGETISCIIGLMIGSIYAVIMAPKSLDVPMPPLSLDNFNLIFFIIGCTMVPILEKFKYILELRDSNINSNCSI